MTKLYVVHRRPWYDHYAVYDGSDFGSDAEGGCGVQVAAFTTKKAAQVRAQELEKQARKEASSPFLLVNEEVLASELDLTEEQLCEAVRALDLEPPEEVQGRYTKYRAWPRWYDSIAATLTPGQFAGLWELFKKLKVYEVVKVELADVEAVP
jgi:hypothetical protein